MPHKTDQRGRRRAVTARDDTGGIDGPSSSEGRQKRRDVPVRSIGQDVGATVPRPTERLARDLPELIDAVRLVLGMCTHVAQSGAKAVLPQEGLEGPPRGIVEGLTDDLAAVVQVFGARFGVSGKQAEVGWWPPVVPENGPSLAGGVLGVTGDQAVVVDRVGLALRTVETRQRGQHAIGPEERMIVSDRILHVADDLARIVHIVGKQDAPPLWRVELRHRVLDLGQGDRPRHQRDQGGSTDNAIRPSTARHDVLLTVTGVFREEGDDVPNRFLKWSSKHLTPMTRRRPRPTTSRIAQWKRRKKPFPRSGTPSVT